MNAKRCPNLLLLCAACVAAYLASLATHTRTEMTAVQSLAAQSGNRQISLTDIAALPPRATHDDVARLLGAYMFADNLIYVCPAGEGGVYVFSFLPMREVSFEPDLLESDMLLVAVMRAESTTDAYDGHFGEYVWPPKVAGRKCSGFGWANP